MFKELNNSDQVFTIAEVGQNHQGDFELAKSYVQTFANCGANAVKFQIRNNQYLFSEEAYNKPYESENAFAATYGEHREKLELSLSEIKQLKKECEKNNVYFMCTPFDEPSLEFLDEIGVDIIKIASFDIGNTPFIEKIALTNRPVVMSIGGANQEEIKNSIKVLEEYNCNLAILHCVSEYPCNFKRLGLANIKALCENYPQHTIGSSDHFNGILSGPVAFLQGARVFEKHVTLDRSFKGTDHSFSLEPEGFRKFVRDIKRVKYMLPPKNVDELGHEPVFQKLGKSITVKESLKIGHRLKRSDLTGKIHLENYIPVRKSENFIGKIIKKEIKANDPIKEDHFS